MDQVNALSRLEDELRRLRGPRGREVVARWAASCPALAGAPVVVPGEVPAWVWGTDREVADRVLPRLVGLAQSWDEVAVVAVLACLRPGLCALAARTGVSVDEVVSEATFAVYEFLDASWWNTSVRA